LQTGLSEAKLMQTVERPPAKRIFDMLMASQFWTKAQLQEFQHSQLLQLLRHAEAQVPFYKNRLGTVLQGQYIDWAGWTSIPILTRTDVLEHREAMQAQTLPPSHGKTSVHRSSGTTGTPVSVTYNGLAELAAGAANIRAQHWHQNDWSKAVCDCSRGGMTFALWPDGVQIGTWGPSWSEQSTGAYWNINRQVTPEQLCLFILAKKVDYLTCRPQTAHAAALEALRLNIKVSLQAILCHGANITDEARADCKAAFGAEMIGLYSTTECHKIAHPCPSSGKYHVNAELMLVEIVDEAGRPCPTGQQGRVIVTPFLSTAQPLIRYDVGDIAVAGGACGCGRNLPVLDHIIGRTTSLFRLADGRKISFFIPPHLKRALGTETWQLAQVAPLGYEVRYVASSNAVANSESKIIDYMREQLGQDIDVRFVRMAQPVVDGDGKFRETVCELP
jgi:phenylacetate-CoA ligase